MSGITEQHADGGYSRRGNFGGSLVRTMVLIHSPDGTNVYGSRSEEFEGIRSVYKRLKVVKSHSGVGTSYSLVPKFLPYIGCIV